MRFKELRVEKGLTQEELTDQFNNRYGKRYTPAAISQIENGKRNPELRALMDFADFFQVSVDFILGRTNIRSFDTTISSEDIALLKKINGLSAENKEAILHMIGYFSEKEGTKPKEKAI